MYSAQYEFIVDTDSYSGNFERELCAYITGHWDNESHGNHQAEIFKEEVGDHDPFEDYITYAPTCDDDMPILAPECLEITPKKYGAAGSYNSVGIFFHKMPPPELIQLMKDRAYKFAKEGLVFDKPVNLKILGFRIKEQVVEEREI